ncbi:MAG: hypothetical protein OXG24_12350 [Gammaproteobacteria bacterium]|nr:hypothetical protein [Gammaproteobacteria bacterium]
MTPKFRASLGFLILLAIAVGLGGCASGAKVTKVFRVPKPLIDSVPVVMGLYISPELRGKTYETKIHQHGKFTIELGESQEHLFSQAFSAVFSELILVQSLDSLPEGIEGVIIPSIVKTELEIPQQTPGDFYSVWIRYSIRIVDSDDEEIIDWIVPAYGRANRHDFSNPLDRPTQALTKARDNAMRDAATQIAFSFTREPAVRDWLTELTQS